MANGDWVWICTCGAIIRRSPEGSQASDAVNTHAAQHREEVAKTATSSSGLGARPTEIVSREDFPSRYAYHMRWTNLDTGEVDARQRFVVENPAYTAFRRHGGTPYQIEPQHGEELVPPVARIDRAIHDVDTVVTLLAQCTPPLPDDADPHLFRSRLAEAVNWLCSAARDIQILKDDLFITYAARDAEMLRERKHLPFETQPMFGLANDERYFNDRGYTMQGPQIIHDALGAYWLTLRRAARSAAMALLAEAAEMCAPSDVEGWSRYRQNLFEATSFTWEQGSDTLQWVRSVIATDDDSTTK